MNIVFDWIVPVPRARRRDPATSKAAAAHATSGAAYALRSRIRTLLTASGPLTAREIAERLGADYFGVQRRMSEVPGLRRTGVVRDGCAEWACDPEPCYFCVEGDKAAERRSA